MYSAPISAEIALLVGNSGACIKYGDELLELSVRNGLPEFEATAHRWRGEALLAKGYVGEAEVALNRALDRATLVGRVRLQLDTCAALARLCAQSGSPDAARNHNETARNIFPSIESGLTASGLGARGRNSSAGDTLKYWPTAGMPLE
jgi:hypothetical protein